MGKQIKKIRRANEKFESIQNEIAQQIQQFTATLPLENGQFNLSEVVTNDIVAQANKRRMIRNKKKQQRRLIRKT